jgi:hypothetical protein
MMSYQYQQLEESSTSNEQTLPESPMPSTYIKAGKKDVNCLVRRTKEKYEQTPCFHTAYESK